MEGEPAALAKEEDSSEVANRATVRRVNSLAKIGQHQSQKVLPVRLMGWAQKSQVIWTNFTRRPPRT